MNCYLLVFSNNSQNERHHAQKRHNQRHLFHGSSHRDPARTQFKIIQGNSNRWIYYKQLKKGFSKGRAFLQIFKESNRFPLVFRVCLWENAYKLGRYKQSQLSVTNRSQLALEYQWNLDQNFGQIHLLFQFYQQQEG